MKNKNELRMIDIILMIILIPYMLPTSYNLLIGLCVVYLIYEIIKSINDNKNDE